jgi:hypothetical protein
MRPLVSGAEAKRYEEPATDTYLLFPYERDAKGVMRLIPADEMEQRFPKAWAHLRGFEQELRRRESKAFDDESWYRFGRNQNIDKQDKAKLVVPRIVLDLKTTRDPKGDFCLDNVDVGGILVKDQIDLDFVFGVMNGPVVNFVFRSIAKPFQGDYRSANRQFIAPLPIPRATPAERAAVGAMAVSLQSRWTKRRELLRAAGERLAVIGRSKREADWLWPTLPSLDDLVEAAPQALRATADRRAWALERLDQAQADKIAALQATLDAGRGLEAHFAGGELRLTSGGETILRGIFLDDAEGSLIADYWRFLLLRQNWSEAASLAAELRRPPVEHAKPAARQFREKVAALAAETTAIAAEEQALNERLYALYGLNGAERLLVENEAARKTRR